MTATVRGGARPEEHRELDLADWDERPAAHAASRDYGFDRFAEAPRTSPTSCGSTCPAPAT